MTAFHLPGKIMAVLTIRNFDEALKARLRLVAAQHGRSMEEEVRQILRRSLQQAPAGVELAARIHQRFAGEGGVELELPPRRRARAPVNIDT